MARYIILNRAAARKKWFFVNLDVDLLAGDRIGATNRRSEDRDAKTAGTAVAREGSAIA